MAKAKPAVVGGFVLGGLALAIAAILLFGGSHLFRSTMHAVVYFNGSVANLAVGAPVTFRGVRVGTVTKIAVTLNMSDLTARIPVDLDLNPSQIFLENGVDEQLDTGFDRLLKAGLRAQLNMQSLITGQLSVDLDLVPGTVAASAGGSPDRPEIPSVPSKLQTLESEIAELPLKDIAENARQALATIQRVADELPRRIGPLVDSLKETSDAAHATLGNIDQLAIAGQHQLVVNGDQLGRVLVSSDRAVHDAETLVTSLTEMTGPESRMRGDLQSAIRDLAASASSLRAFTHEVERDPSALLSGRASR